MQYVNRLWDVKFYSNRYQLSKSNDDYKVIQPFKLIAVKMKGYSDCAISNF